MKHLLFAMFVWLVADPVSAESKKFVPPSAAVFPALEATEIECPAAEHDRYMGHLAVRCARAPYPLKTLRKLWRKTAKDGTAGVSWDHSPWKKGQGEARRMHVFAGGLPIEIRFDEAAGLLTMAWPESYPGCHRESQFEWFPETVDVQVFERVGRADPEFPREARIQRTGGAVMASLLVDEEGRLIDVCWIGVTPPGLGFREASEASLRAATFTPAKRNGRPVRLAAFFNQTFHINMEGSFAAYLIRDYFDRVRVDPSE